MSVANAIRESARCARNLALGGSVDFWVTRLRRRIAELETERAVLQACLVAISSYPPSTSPEPVEGEAE